MLETLVNRASMIGRIARQVLFAGCFTVFGLGLAAIIAIVWFVT